MVKTALLLAAAGMKVGVAMRIKMTRVERGVPVGMTPLNPAPLGRPHLPGEYPNPHRRVDQSCKSQAGTSPELAYTKDRGSGLCPDPC